MRRERLYVNDRGQCVMHVSGFSWWAAMAMPVWAFHRRLYGLALLTYALGGLVSFLAPAQSMLLYFGQFFVYGALANRAHRFLLERRGWSVTAEEPEAAKGLR